MRPFEYIRCEQMDGLTVPEKGCFIAGGTNLVDLMKHGIETPSHLVDISRMALDSVEVLDSGVIRVGSQVTNTALANHRAVRGGWPVLSAALLSGATQQLRNKASTGGNFLQRTRCYYFYDTARACNKRNPGSGCDAKDGFNRIHAILGASDHCIATHPSDMAVAMTCIDAQLRTRRADGSTRCIPVRDLYRLPGDTPHIETVLEHGELITHVDLPKPGPGNHVYRKARDRASYAFALVSVAAVLSVNDGRIDTARVALGGVAPKPWHAARAEEVLVGSEPTDATFERAADAVLEDAVGHGDNDFKIPLARRLMVSVFREATGGEA